MSHKRKFAKPSQRIFWFLALAGGAIATLIASENLKGATSWWLYYPTLVLVGLGAFQFQRIFEPRRLVDWRSAGEHVSASVVTASRWAGEVVALREVIRSALLSGEAHDDSTVAVHRSDKRSLFAVREPRGWRIEGASQDEFSDLAIYRSQSGIDPVRAPAWYNLRAAEPGDFLTLEETEEILAAFADKEILPSNFVERTIIRG